MRPTDSWQYEADLLADGREFLERQCATTRYRHLFPTGPNMALLFRAYQELDRWRTVRRRPIGTKRAMRRDKRRLRRLIKQLVNDDAIARDRRLVWRYPLPRPQTLHAHPPEPVLQALYAVDDDARREVAAIVHGRELPTAPPSASTSASASASGTTRAEGRIHRGLQQFREALINAAIAHPKQIPRLHPQYLQFMASPQPTRRKHPIATMLLVKLPLQLLMILILIFNLAYLGAYHFFNDERLGAFLTDKIGVLLDGELTFGAVHWSPMLIVDLLTGQPHTVHGYDLEVWEGFKIDEIEKSKRTAYAEHVEVELVIHEIIPWNRLGIPGMLEIPWVLHFEDIDNHGELWVDVRSYQNHHRGGEWMISLVNAFDTYKDLHAPPELKKLSFQIDHGQLDGLALTLDLEQRSGWAVTLDFEEIVVGLDYEGWAPIDYLDTPEHKPEVLPLRYEVSARGGVGAVLISNIHPDPIALSSLDELEIASGMNYRPIGDMWVAGAAVLGGSPTVFEGRLLDVLGDLRFDFELGTTNLGPIVELLYPPEIDEEGRERTMIAARGSPATLKAKGPVDDVVLQAVGQGLTLDLFPEPAWALDDVDVSLSLALDPRPETWASLPINTTLLADELSMLRQAHEAGELDEEGPVDPDGGAEPVDDGEDYDDGQRWIVYLDTLRGSALDGEVRLHRRAGQDHIVLPAEGEPLLISIYLDLIGVNLGQLTPEDDEIRAMLSGETNGGLQIHQVIIGDEGLDHAEAELHRAEITRDHGPDDDGLPRKLRADGEIIWDSLDGVDLRGLRIGVDGGQLRISGGLDSTYEELDPTSASIRVDNGEAFLRAFGFPRWFDSLSADFSASGPLDNPRGSGSLDITGAGSGALAVDEIRDAKLEFRRGTLSLRSDRVGVLGGRGPLSADLVLLDAKGKALADPKARVTLELHDINRSDILGSGIGAQNATIELVLDDGTRESRPVPLSQLQARGGAYAETLSLLGVDYRNAEARFAFTRDGIELDRMTLAYHRPVSPAKYPQASVPIGSVEASGSIGFADDPTLDLDVRAINLPLSAIAQSLELDLPVRGQIARGSNLEVTGTLRRPDISGQLVLAQLGAAGVPLGGGVLEFSSEDVPYHQADLAEGQAAIAAHRQVKIGGELRGKPNPESSEGDLTWRIDATVAFSDRKENPIEAAADLGFTNLPLDTLFAHPSRAHWRTQVVGGLQQLVVRTRYCPSHEGEQLPLLSACAEVDPDDPRVLAGESVRVDLSLANLWYRGHRKGGSVAGADPCLESDTTCSITPLRARLEGTQLSLAEPWVLRSGGKNGPQLQIAGSFDLTGDDDDDDEPTPEPEPTPDDPELPTVTAVETRRPRPDTPTQCIPGIPDNASLPPGQSAATIVGGLDFSAIAPFVAASGLENPVGQLAIQLDIGGVVTRPTITGHVRLPTENDATRWGLEPRPIVIDLADAPVEGETRRRTRPIPIEIPTLDLRMAGGTVYLTAAVEIYGERLSVGSINGRDSYLDLAGPCSGHFGLSAGGSLDGALARRLLPELVESSGGAVDLRSLHVTGSLDQLTTYLEELERYNQLSALGSDEPFEFSGPAFTRLSGAISLDRKALRMSTSSLGELRLASGEIEFRQCTSARPCPSRDASEPRLRRGLLIWVGGQRSARSKSRPSDALTLRVGDRGRTDLWGELLMADTFHALEHASLTAAAKEFPIDIPDNSGRTQLEAALSSDQIAFVTDGVNGRITGEIMIDRSVWLRDARQGIAVLSFADPNPSPPSQLPGFIRDLELDMQLRTVNPFRVDNNVAKQFEARADLRLGGTVGDPDLSGTIDIERGVIDIDILGGAYDVARGRVLVNHDPSQSIVDLVATRQKQIKINNQLLTLNLRLSGTLDAIQWECSAPGDTSGALTTTRGCVDYLIFDAGNTDLAASDIRDNRNNANNLLGSRFLPLAGRLAQVDVNEVLEDEIPRLEGRIPDMRVSAGQIGLDINLETPDEWLNWGWGRMKLNFQYTRGYPGSVIRDSRSFSWRMEILENAALEAAFGLRNYTNRVLIVDPPSYSSIQYRQRFEVPSRR